MSKENTDANDSFNSEESTDEKFNRLIAEGMTMLEKLRNSGLDESNSDFFRKQANILADIGILYLKKGVIDKARDFIMASLRDFQKLEDMVGISSAKGALGTLFLNQGDYFTAKNYFKEAYEYWNEAPYLNERIATLNSLGICDLNLGNESEGVDRILKAVSIAIKLGDPDQFVNSLELLLRYYEEKNEFDVLRELKFKALEFWSKSEEFEERQYKTLVDIGVLSQLLNDFDTALNSFKKAFNIALKRGDFRKSYLAQGFVGEVLVSMKEIDKAIDAYLNAYMISLLIDLDTDADHTNESEQMKTMLLTLGTKHELIEEKKKVAIEERIRIRKEIEDARKLLKNQKIN